MLWNMNEFFDSNLGHSMLAYLGIAVVAVGLPILYQWLLPKPLPGIAYNPEATKSLFGDAPNMSREIGLTGEFSMWLAKQVERMNSPVCQVFVRPFSKPWILIADFREAQDILMRRAEFDKPAFLSDGMLCLGDFHARYKTNDAFRERRRMKQDLMTPTFLNGSMGPAMHAKGLELVRLLEMKAELANGRPFSIKADYDYAALDVMLSYAFGDNLDDSAIRPQLDHIAQLDRSQIPDGAPDEPVVFRHAPISPFLQAVHDAPEVLEKTTVSWAPRLSHWWWKQQPWYKKIFEQKSRVVPQQLSKAITNYRKGTIKSALEHMLMREAAMAEKQSRQPQFESQTLVDEAFADLIAGHHTTGGSMGWVTKFLTGYPETQASLRAALYAAIPEAVGDKRSPTFDELRRAKVPYLEAVIEEMLRLTPFSMTREVTTDTEILGHKIPKGCQVFMVNGGPGYLSPSLPVDEAKRSPTSQIARVRGNWDESKDLKLFDPERWLVVKGDGSVDFDGGAGPQLGFGMGIRQCWGRRMAHLEIRTIIALIVWNFDLLDIPNSLGGYAGFDGISRQPQRVFIRLRRRAL
ncbi:cytochrome P450 [Aspergillus alliaceus]|uniref:cytochrome P450 n=1 Tax=Petromyces alliaceus TaxID=209559 RepID=UPI0012A6879D|nr:cytochrome P450 [Aspergillus alliaceus]KAB8235182.1 cytochrome P450 [Aspergillus alliaceus]